MKILLYDGDAYTLEHNYSWTGPSPATVDYLTRMTSRILEALGPADGEERGAVFRIVVANLGAAVIVDNDKEVEEPKVPHDETKVY